MDGQDNFAWPSDMFNEDGQVDMDAFMAMLEENPDLMEQFHEMYGADDGAMISDYDYDAGMPNPQTMQDLAENCALPTLQSALDSVKLLLLACIVCNLVTRLLFEWSAKFVHAFHAAIGVCMIYKFFGENGAILGLYMCLTVALLTLDVLPTRKLGGALFIITLIYTVGCELILEPEKWHMVRGAQMILAMKVISLAFDLDSEDLTGDMLSIWSYLLHPCSVIFGPWLSYQYYCDGLEFRKRWTDWNWVIAVIKSGLGSVLCLLWSVCIISWLLPSSYDLGKWADAYRDAQSFRTSHYFICLLSEFTMLLSGIAIYSPLGYMISSNEVTKPHIIELPRSLVSIVTNWNLSMHQWLKIFVFKKARPKWGTLAAVLLTYIASSLLHGVNFQLAAVLLSLGVYSYVEHSLRKVLASSLQCCVEARACPGECKVHSRQWKHPLTLTLNILFTMVTMFHLAYLGVMFDTTPNEQEKGYSMLHTLKKWSHLDYASHIVICCTFFFYVMIR